jgi:hypothetical protein
MTFRWIFTSTQPDTSPSKEPQSNRYVWVVTVYGISGLALLAVMAYYIGTYFGR